MLSANLLSLEESKIGHLGKANDKFSDWSKSKGVADDKSNVAEKLKVVLGRVENIVGKGENAGFQHFLLFLIRFQKGFSVGVVESRDCVVKSKWPLLTFYSVECFKANITKHPRNNSLLLFCEFYSMHLPAFSPFPTLFSKRLLCWSR